MNPEPGDKSITVTVEDVTAGLRDVGTPHATLRCARAHPMVDEWLKIAEADPRRWLPEVFQRWLEYVQRDDGR